MKKGTLPIILLAILSLTAGCNGDDGNGPAGDDTTLYDVSVTVSPDGAGTIAPSADSTYEEGETAELTAEASDNYVFAGWTGDLGNSDNPLSLTVDEDYSLIANFEKKSYALATNTYGEGVIAEEIVQQKTTDYEHGTVVELTAAPAGDWRFVEWGGDLSGSENPTQITVDTPKEVTAIFEKKSYELTVLTEGQGAVSEEVVQAKAYEHGTVVELTPSPAEGWRFAGWEGDHSGTENPAQITVSQKTTIVAKFLPPFYLAPNDVTIMCPKAELDQPGLINGVIYVKRDTSQITPANASTTCTSGITDMSKLFKYESSFNEDISHWDVSSVTDMSGMFLGAESFNQDLSNWDVSNVTDMTGMFGNATAFNQDISKWDVSSVTDMGSMFKSAEAFNQGIGNWDVSNVTDMGYLFNYASAFNQDLGGWNVNNVTNMSSMFNQAEAFNQDIGSWDVSSVINMGNMFSYASSFNQDISQWDVSNATRLHGMFINAETFNQDIGGWDVSNVTAMAWMFYNAGSFNQDLSGWCVENISAEQNNFSTGSALTASHKPVWGTCPSP